MSVAGSSGSSGSEVAQKNGRGTMPLGGVLKKQRRHSAPCDSRVRYTATQLDYGQNIAQYLFDKTNWSRELKDYFETNSDEQDPWYNRKIGHEVRADIFGQDGVSQESIDKILKVCDDIKDLDIICFASDIRLANSRSSSSIEKDSSDTDSQGSECLQDLTAIQQKRVVGRIVQAILEDHFRKIVERPANSG